MNTSPMSFARRRLLRTSALGAGVNRRRAAGEREQFPSKSSAGFARARRESLAGN